MGPIGEILGIPLGWVMKLIYQVIPNYGIAIILFTLLTKLALFPTGYKQQLNSARMQTLNPKLANLRKQYANNNQKLAEEQQKLYAQEGINPMGSCLPLIVTMILLYGIIDVVYRPLTHILEIGKSTISSLKEIILNAPQWEGIKMTRPELTIMQKVKEDGAYFVGEGIDQSVVNEIANFDNKFLGVDLGRIPTISPDTWDKAAIALIMIPIFSCLIQFVYSIYTQHKSKQMNPGMQSNGCMNVMIFGMPLFSLWIAFTVPAGVGFYWIWSSVFSFVQSIILYAYFTPKRVEVINAKIKEKNKNKKPGFMQQMLNQQAQQTQSAGREEYVKAIENMSKSEKNRYNRELLKEARKRMAEKYGEEYVDDDSED